MEPVDRSAGARVAGVCSCVCLSLSLSVMEDDFYDLLATKHLLLCVSVSVRVSLCPSLCVGACVCVCVCVNNEAGAADDEDAGSLPGELFFFDYGVVVMWSLTSSRSWFYRCVHACLGLGVCVRARVRGGGGGGHAGGGGGEEGAGDPARAHRAGRRERAGVGKGRGGGGGGATKMAKMQPTPPTNTQVFISQRAACVRA